MRNTQPLIEEDELAAAASHAEQRPASSGHVRVSAPLAPLTPMPGPVTPASFPPEHVPLYSSGVAPKGSNEPSTMTTTAPGSRRPPPPDSPAPAPPVFPFADGAQLQWFLAGLLGGLVVFSIAAVIAWAFAHR